MNINNNSLPVAIATVLAGSAGLVSAPASYADGGYHHDGNYCSKTAYIARQACKKDISDDFLLATATCLNFEDDEERRECRAEAREAKKEGREECNELLEARLEACELLGESRYDPEVDPAMFVPASAIGDTVAPNPYFDLTPGYTRVYEGGDETTVVTVTDVTMMIMGVECTVIRDTVSEDGELIEDTLDWHAQDIYGNVWYFGEIAQNFEDGVLTDIDGSFKAGEDGAKPGIIMPAMPQPGDAYREEWALSEAEDYAEVISVTADESTDAASCGGACVQTRNVNPLDAGGDQEYKYYAPGIGVIVETGVDDPDDRTEIVDFYHAAP